MDSPEPRLEYHRRVHYTKYGRCQCWYFDYVQQTECLNCARERRNGGRDGNA